jgi:hypothetical protein
MLEGRKADSTDARRLRSTSVQYEPTESLSVRRSGKVGLSTTLTGAVKGGRKVVELWYRMFV